MAQSQNAKTAPAQPAPDQPPAPAQAPGQAQAQASGQAPSQVPGQAGDAASRAREAIAQLRARGVALHEKEQLDEAITQYQRYLFYRPRDVSIWNNLGVALRKKEHFPAAVACYQRALELSPGDPGLLGNLGNALKDLDRIDEAIEAHRQALEQRPEDFSLHQNFGITFREAARFADALEQFDICLAMQPGHDKIRWDRALALLHLGRFDEGWRDYEARWKIGELPARAYQAPKWLGEDIGGKTILLYPEQGFGDTILASRFLPLVKARGARVWLECKPALRRLFDELEGVDRLVVPGEVDEGFDVHTSLMSLLGIFKADPEGLPALPRLAVPEAARKKMAPLLSGSRDRFKIGVVWSGSTTFKGNRKRSVTPEHFIELATIPGVQLFSLQKGPREQDLQSSGAAAVMIDIGSRVEDFAETAAVLQGLDLIIMTDSSVAHLAGALGRPVWDLLNFSTYWLYGGTGETTPWYPSFRLFRQPRPGDWSSVFATVKRELANTVAQWHAARREARRKAQPEEQAQGQDDGEVIVPSVFRTADGEPRFVMPLPRASLKDPGINHLQVYETRFGGFEFAARNFFDQHLMPGDLFLDVGAHWGMFALTAATRWPEDVQVLALEPVAGNVERLRKAIAVNRLGDQIEVVAKAVGDKLGQAAMGPQSTMGHNIVAVSDGDQPPRIDDDKAEVVALTTIDHELDQRPAMAHGRVFMKIDVEGFEPEVIAGAARLIRSGRVSAIAWERGRAFDQPERAAALKNMMDALRDQGFNHFRFPNDTLGGPLMPYVPCPDLCNVYSLSLGFERKPHYARPPGPSGHHVRPASPSFPEDLRRQMNQALIAAKASDAARWADARCLEEGADERAALAAPHLGGARRILDLGAGLEKLRPLLAQGATYIPVDLVRRSEDTLIADLNQGQFPEVEADDAVLLEVLEYVHDVPGLLRRCHGAAKRLVFSYHPAEDGDNDPRRLEGWFNDYPLGELNGLLAGAGWSVETRQQAGDLYLFVCRRM